MPFDWGSAVEGVGAPKVAAFGVGDTPGAAEAAFDDEEGTAGVPFGDAEDDADATPEAEAAGVGAGDTAEDEAAEMPPAGVATGAVRLAGTTSGADPPSYSHGCNFLIIVESNDG